MWKVQGRVGGRKSRSEFKFNPPVSGHVVWLIPLEMDRLEDVEERWCLRVDTHLGCVHCRFNLQNQIGSVTEEDNL